MRFGVLTIELRARGALSVGRNKGEYMLCPPYMSQYLTFVLERLCSTFSVRAPIIETSVRIIAFPLKEYDCPHLVCIEALDGLKRLFDELICLSY